MNVLVEFFVQREETLAFIIRAEFNEPVLVRLALDSSAVTKWAKHVRSAVQRETSLSEAQQPVQPVLDALVAHATPGDVVCFVPHGVLHHVPFHAFEIGGGALVRRHAVVYAPSASVLAGILGRVGAHEHGHSAVVIGDTRDDLPHASAEATAVAERFSVPAILGSEATRSRVIEALRGAKRLRVLHLACHGAFDPSDAFRSGIATAAAGSGAPSLVSVRDLRDVDLRADLVALSACDSGLSDSRAGDEMVGLTRALLVSGAQSVLGSVDGQGFPGELAANWLTSRRGSYGSARNATTENKRAQVTA